MFHCPVGVSVIEQRAIILSATVRSPTVVVVRYWSYTHIPQDSFPSTRAIMPLFQASEAVLNMNIDK